jgi:transposase
MKKTLDPLGIDIAKQSFQVTLLHARRTHRAEFPNSPAGFQALARWLQQHGARRVHACLEATGRYGEALAEFLHAGGETVSLVNPAQIKDYGRSKLSRNKTDAIDADLIADFCRTQAPVPWTPPAPELQELRALLRQYEALQDMHTQESNRLKAGNPSVTVLALLREHLAFIDQQLKQLYQQIQEHIDRHPGLKAEQELLDSIQGVSTITAAKLVAEDLTRFDDARAAVAFAGLNPQRRDSGRSLGRSQLSRMGRPGLRKSLYMPTLSAMRCNPIIRQFSQRLTERGKLKMQVIAAAMRKLLCLAYGVLKTRRPFDPNYIATSFAA